VITTKPCVSDRIVVYYFPTKDDVIGEALDALGARLQQTLAPGFARAAWPFLASEAADPVFALFFEAGGLAATGREPYRTLVPPLIEASARRTRGRRPRMPAPSGSGSAQRPSVSSRSSATSAPEKFCCPVSRLPSRMANGLNRPAWM
jgi:hypothetical protein